jgi:hypothetical protein
MGMTLRALAVSFTALLVAACSAGSGPAAPSPAAASATAASTLAASRTSYAFPTTAVGRSAVSPSFDLSATGSGSLVVSNITTSNPAEFPIASTTNCLGATMTAGAPGCGIFVTFQPTASGVRSAQIAVTSSGGSVVFDVFGAGATPTTGAVTPPGDGSTAGGGSAGGSSPGGGGSTGGDPSSGTAPPGQFQQAPCVPNGAGTIDVHIINSTALVITLTFTGPVTQSASMAPKAIAVLTPQPGNYVITGQVSGATNATLSPSNWSLASGCDYVLQLVSSAPARLSLRSVR